MGLALLTFSKILTKNKEELNQWQNTFFDETKYRERAMQVITANDFEIFSNNNFGYQGAQSRQVERLVTPPNRRLVYDRTQKSTNLINNPSLAQLKEVIEAGNEFHKRGIPTNAIICSGDNSSPKSDWDVAGSCWNHLPFEAEDYYRIMRVTEGWQAPLRHDALKHLDAIARNLAATSNWTSSLSSSRASASARAITVRWSR